MKPFDKTKSFGDTGIVYEDISAFDSDDPPWAETVNLATSFHGGSYSGDVTKNFHKIVSNGGLLPHNRYRNVEYAAEVSHGSTGFTDNTGASWGFNGTIFPGYLFLPVYQDCPLSIEMDPYLTDAAANVFDGFDALTTVAELGKTWGLVRGALGRALKLYRKARKLNLSVNDACRTYLEFRYGWRILAYDVENISQALNAVSGLKILSKRATASVSNDSSYDVYSQAGNWRSTITVSDSWTLEGAARFTALAQVDAINSSPIQTAWELIPFSFIVDWFFSIGSAISNLANLGNVKESRSSVSYKYTLKRVAEAHTIEITSSSWNEREVSGGISGTLEVDMVAKTRDPASVPRIPGFRMKLNPYKILDLIAIVQQMR
jgi:hypothetical protein